MKKYWNFIILSIVVFVLFMFTLNLTFPQIPIQKGSGVNASLDTYSINFDVFYVNAEHLLESEKVEAKIHESTYIETIFELLKNQPRTKGLFSPINSPVVLNKYEISGTNLKLDFSKDFLMSTYWIDEYHDTVLYAVINTYTSLSNVDTVNITVEGVDINIYTKRPEVDYFTFNESIVQKVASDANSVIKLFLDYLDIDRYDLAYKLTSSSVKNVMDDTNFLSKMQSFKEERKENYRNINYLKLTDMFHYVEVKYYKVDEENLQEIWVGKDIWRVVKVATGEWLVVWPR